MSGATSQRDPGPLGRPRLHLRRTTSTNERARELAAAGAPHGTLVTAAEQTAGRGRQGRVWLAPPGSSLLCSVVIRDPRRLLPLAAGAAVAGAAEAAVADADAAAGGAHGATRAAAIKWPNDVLLSGRKVAGILVEGRPQDRWAVVGIGLNVAVAQTDFPPELADRAGTLALGTDQIEPTLQTLLARLERWLVADDETLLAEVRARDALLGRPVRWAGGEGQGDGIDGEGRLVVLTPKGRVTLDAGEVHLMRE
jgi:BirA family biotin operon repressor/biotin-[acetyl-CoA-carboxylase] ligase